MVWAWKQDLKPPPKLALLALADYANHNLESWPALDTLAARTGMGRRTVIRALEHLEAAGLISRQPRDKGGRQTSNLYRLEGCQSDTPPPPEGRQSDTPGGVRAAPPGVSERHPILREEPPRGTTTRSGNPSEPVAALWAKNRKRANVQQLGDLARLERKVGADAMLEHMVAFFRAGGSTLQKLEQRITEQWDTGIPMSEAPEVEAHDTPDELRRKGLIA